MKLNIYKYSKDIKSILKTILGYVITVGLIVIFVWLMDIGITATLVGLIIFSVFMAIYMLWQQRETYNMVTQLGASYIRAVKNKDKKVKKKNE